MDETTGKGWELFLQGCSSRAGKGAGGVDERWLWVRVGCGGETWGTVVGRSVSSARLWVASGFPLGCLWVDRPARPLPVRRLTATLCVKPNGNLDHPGHPGHPGHAGMQARMQDTRQTRALAILDYTSVLARTVLVCLHPLLLNSQSRRLHSSPLSLSTTLSSLSPSLYSCLSPTHLPSISYDHTLSAPSPHGLDIAISPPPTPLLSTSLCLVRLPSRQAFLATSSSRWRPSRASSPLVRAARPTT